MSPEHDDETTTFEMNPLGARQRVLPNPTFVAGAEPVRATTVRAASIVPELPAVATVWRNVTASPARRSMWPSIPLVTAPLGVALAVLVTVASFLLQPPEPQAPVIAIASAHAGVELVASVAHLEVPAMSEEAEIVEAVEAPKQRARKKPSSRRPRMIVAGDTSTPLGNLRPRR